MSHLVDACMHGHRIRHVATRSPVHRTTALGRLGRADGARQPDVVTLKTTGMASTADMGADGRSPACIDNRNGPERERGAGVLRLPGRLRRATLPPNSERRARTHTTPLRTTSESSTASVCVPPSNATPMRSTMGRSAPPHPPLRPGDAGVRARSRFLDLHAALPRTASGPAIVVAWRMISSIRRIAPSPRSTSAAASASSTCFGLRVPTIATWTAGLANVQAMASCPSVRPSSRRAKRWSSLTTQRPRSTT